MGEKGCIFSTLYTLYRLPLVLCNVSASCYCKIVLLSDWRLSWWILLPFGHWTPSFIPMWIRILQKWVSWTWWRCLCEMPSKILLWECCNAHAVDLSRGKTLKVLLVSWLKSMKCIGMKKPVTLLYARDFSVLRGVLLQSHVRRALIALGQVYVRCQSARFAMGADTVLVLARRNLPETAREGSSVNDNLLAP